MCYDRVYVVTDSEKNKEQTVTIRKQGSFRPILSEMVLI